MIDSDYFREQLAEILPKSQHKKIDRIVELIDEDEITTVGVYRTHVGIETVEAYGLTIRVDANGYASEIDFPMGAEVLA